MASASAPTSHREASKMGYVEITYREFFLRLRIYRIGLVRIWLDVLSREVQNVRVLHNIKY
jgi:hypothetical protein